MRLIDVDEIEELFREVISGIAKKQEMTGNLEHMVRASAMVIEMLHDAPTVDAVPVVRCRDCKHWRIFVRSPIQDGVFKSGKLWKYCINANAMTPEDGYCHRAESGARKDGDGNG